MTNAGVQVSDRPQGFPDRFCCLSTARTSPIYDRAIGIHTGRRHSIQQCQRPVIDVWCQSRSGFCGNPLGRLSPPGDQRDGHIGVKRIGHAAVEVFLVLNGFELSAGSDDAERVILGVAAGTISRDEFTKWIRESLVAFPAP